jgi:hypothetical protein
LRCPKSEATSVLNSSKNIEITSEMIAENYQIKLSLSDQTLDTLLDPALWKSLCPYLSVTQPQLTLTCLQTPEELQKLGSEMGSRGYFKMPKLSLGLTELFIDNLARGIRALEEHGYPANFILLYDEPWMIGELIGKVLEPSSGNVTPISNSDRYWRLVCV